MWFGTVSINPVTNITSHIMCYTVLKCLQIVLEQNLKQNILANLFSGYRLVYHVSWSAWHTNMCLDLYKLKRGLAYVKRPWWKALKIQGSSQKLAVMVGQKQNLIHKKIVLLPPSFTRIQHKTNLNLIVIMKIFTIDVWC